MYAYHLNVCGISTPLDSQRFSFVNPHLPGASPGYLSFVGDREQDAFAAGRQGQPDTQFDRIASVISCEATH